MLKSAGRCLVWFCLPVAMVACAASAQEPGPEDEMIDQIRKLEQIGATDQERIRRGWVDKQVEKYTDFAAFRKRFRDQYTNAGNSPQFMSQFAAQTATVVATNFGKSDLRPEVAWGLAQVLLDMNRAETRPGLIACLKSSDARARYLCAKGLIGQKTSIAAAATSLQEAVQALREAGLVESDPVVLERIYEALAIPGQAAAVFDAYLAVFDKRLETRRRDAISEDGAEIDALEFFRTPGVAGSLTADQKTQLVSRLAVFLRMDAERYQEPSLRFNEIDKVERMLDSEEEVLVLLVGSSGGDVRGALSAGARQNKGAVLEQAYRWVGHPDQNTRGALNDAPWNVSVGAP